MIDNFRNLFGNDGSGNGGISAPGHLVVERFVFRIVLNGVDRCVTECDLQVFVAVLARMVVHPAVGIIRSGDEPAIREEVFL